MHTRSHRRRSHRRMYRGGAATATTAASAPATLSTPCEGHGAGAYV